MRDIEKGRERERGGEREREKERKRERGSERKFTSVSFKLLSIYCLKSCKTEQEVS